MYKRQAAARPFAPPAGWKPVEGALVRLRPGLGEKNGLRAGELATVARVFTADSSADLPEGEWEELLLTVGAQSGATFLRAIATGRAPSSISAASGSLNGFFTELDPPNGDFAAPGAGAKGDRASAAPNGLSFDASGFAAPVPAPGAASTWADRYIERVLFSKSDVEGIIARLGASISNDYAARVVVPCVWIINEKETVQVLKHILKDALEIPEAEMKEAAVWGSPELKGVAVPQ